VSHLSVESFEGKYERDVVDVPKGNGNEEALISCNVSNFLDDYAWLFISQGYRRGDA
jgi:hypothetical protein